MIAKYFSKIDSEKMYGNEDIKIFVPFYKYNNFDFKDIIYTGTVLLSNEKIACAQVIMIFH